MNVQTNPALSQWFRQSQRLSQTSIERTLASAATPVKTVVGSWKRNQARATSAA